MFKSRSFFLYCLVFILAACIGIYFRLFPLRGFSSQMANDKASLFVISQIKGQLAEQIMIKYPQASSIERNQLLKKELDRVIHDDREKIKATIEEISKRLDSQTNSSKKYLLESDSFYYYGLTQNILNTGRIAPQIKGSKFLHEQMMAPLGHWEPLNLHPYVGAMVYKTIKLFKPNVDLMFALGFTPVIIATLTLIPFLFLLYRLNIDALLALIGSIFFILNPIFIKRSTWGWYDNDPYNVLFTLLIALAVYCYVHRPLSFKRSALYAGLVSLLFMMYAFFWHGWMFIFTTLLISVFVMILYCFTLYREGIKHLLTFLGVVIAGTFLAITLIFGPDQFFVLFAEGWKALTNFLKPQLSLWPDLYITVGELHASTLPLLLSMVGGIFFYIVAAVGLTFMAVKFLRDESHVAKLFAVFILIFWALSLYLALGAQRFNMFHFLPLAIAFALGLQVIFDLAVKFSARILKNNSVALKILPGILSLLALSSLILPMSHMQKSLAFLLNPIFNETWEKSLIKIKEQTPPNSIINTWWPPGHFIKAIANRRVTFDGASINYPQAYWMANFFLAHDEKYALGILRMLNNSGNRAAEFLQEKGLKLSFAVEMLKHIVTLNQTQAQEFLAKFLSKEDSLALLKLTHAHPPPSYIFIYKEFVDKNLQLPFVANWNIKRMEEINSDPALLKAVPKKSSKDYINFLWELSGGPLKYSEPIDQLSQSQDVLYFDQGIQINTKTMDTLILSSTFGQGTPHSLLYLEGNQVKEKVYPAGKLPYSVILFRQEKHHSVVLMDQRLAQSILMRMYYFKGQGFKYMRPVIEEKDLTARNVVYVFEVDWERYFADLN